VSAKVVLVNTKRIPLMDKYIKISDLTTLKGIAAKLKGLVLKVENCELTDNKIPVKVPKMNKKDLYAIIDGNTLYYYQNVNSGGKMKRCVLCGKKYEGYGNNARPLKEGYCCDLCNITKVIPERLKQR